MLRRSATSEVKNKSLVICTVDSNKSKMSNNKI